MTSQEPTAGNPLWKVLIPVALIFVAVVGGLFLVKSQLPQKSDASATAAGAPGEIRVGSVIPDITLHRFSSGTTQLSSLASETKAKVILINFWATWCEACVTEMPSIVRLQNQYKGKGLEVVFINVDEQPDQVLPKALKQLNITGPVYSDPNGEIAEIFDVHAIPLTAIVDKDRKVLLLESGERDWTDSEIRSQLDRWLSG